MVRQNVAKWDVFLILFLDPARSSRGMTKRAAGRRGRCGMRKEPRDDGYAGRQKKLRGEEVREFGGAFKLRFCVISSVYFMMYIQKSLFINPEICN